MAVLGGVDGTDDDLGCQKTSRIQKGIWKGLPPPEESYDTVYILNCVIRTRRNSSSGHAWSP
jgi:hypothetical protein